MDQTPQPVALNGLLRFLGTQVAARAALPAQAKPLLGMALASNAEYALGLPGDIEAAFGFDGRRLQDVRQRVHARLTEDFAEFQRLPDEQSQS